jgi:hypothetical protein
LHLRERNEEGRGDSRTLHSAELHNFTTHHTLKDGENKVRIEK